MSVIANHMSKELLRAGPTSRSPRRRSTWSRGTSGRCSSWTVIALEGILTERDILKAVAVGLSESVRVRDWMTRNPETIEASDSTEHAAALMIHGGFRHLPVLDGGKRGRHRLDPRPHARHARRLLAPRRLSLGGGEAARPPPPGHALPLDAGSSPLRCPRPEPSRGTRGTQVVRSTDETDSSRELRGRTRPGPSVQRRHRPPSWPARTHRPGLPPARRPAARPPSPAGCCTFPRLHQPVSHGVPAAVTLRP